MKNVFKLMSLLLFFTLFSCAQKTVELSQQEIQKKRWIKVSDTPFGDPSDLRRSFGKMHYPDGMKDEIENLEAHYRFRDFFEKTANDSEKNMRSEVENYLRKAAETESPNRLYLLELQSAILMLCDYYLPSEQADTEGILYAVSLLEKCKSGNSILVFEAAEKLKGKIPEKQFIELCSSFADRAKQEFDAHEFNRKNESDLAIAQLAYDTGDKLFAERGLYAQKLRDLSAVQN